MSDTLIRSTREAEYIYNVAPTIDQRTGQLLFNSLKHEIAEKVRGTFFDPFYKDLSLWQIIEWYEHHIVFGDDGSMICLFSGNVILWEDPNA